MKAIILAGGKATRLPDSAKEIPKVLVEVSGKPILQHQIDLLEGHGFHDIRLALGNKAQQVIDYLKGRYGYVIEPEPLGTGGAIKFASRDLTEPFIVLNGDVLSNINMREFSDLYQASDARHMLAAWQVSDVRDFGHLGLDWIQSKSENHAPITAFLEKPAKKQSGFINAGIYILHPKDISGHRHDSFSIEHDIFPNLVADGKLHAYIHPGWWMEMGTEERLKQVRRDFEELTE